MTKTAKPLSTIKDGAECTVIAGTHAGKSGTVRDIHISATGHMTVTVVQSNGTKFKTLGKNIAIKTKRRS